MFNRAVSGEPSFYMRRIFAVAVPVPKPFASVDSFCSNPRYVYYSFVSPRVERSRQHSNHRKTPYSKSRSTPSALIRMFGCPVEERRGVQEGNGVFPGFGFVVPTGPRMPQAFEWPILYHEPLPRSIG